MKRISGLYEQIYSIQNLELADRKAQKGKSKQRGVKKHNETPDYNLWKLQNSLIDKTYKTSSYTKFKVFEPKERDVFKLPYFPDRILHHAIMNILEPIWVGCFTKDTYSCIKGKGIHAASFSVRESLRDYDGTTYCLKLDIKKFYPSVNHCVLKLIIRRKIKDPYLLELLDEIIGSSPGIPIGNLMSQYFANLYMTYFDHWIKENRKVKYYFRYCDDLVILSNNKPYLHQLLSEIREYLSVNLKLTIKSNYQIFPVESRGIDFVGYVVRHSHTRLRKSIKKNCIKRMSLKPNLKSFASYYGWIKFCNGRHLLKKIINENISRLGDQNYLQEFRREKRPN